MEKIIKELYDVILARKDESEDNSYTGYLFREGIDKILKKVGEESSEVIIAAKSLEAAGAANPEIPGYPETSVAANPGIPGNFEKPAVAANLAALRDDFVGEVCDLLYHLLVLLVERGVPLEDIEAVLAARAAKTGNLKQTKR
ncbi:MAG: phosphoribosyl-ATP diphosphatase [Clostridiales Family XIII bacterium]|jgi:phosphoribosyl-ATP pyrophosphohydrolase|nr:phosphoribosyl-ATP diphosphatase [Clostridiales Family XIII bacterium]